MIDVGSGWSTFSARRCEGSLREAEANRWPPEPGLVVDSASESAMPTASQQVHPDAERGVGDDLPWSDGALDDLTRVLADDLGQHLRGDVIEE